MESKVQNLSMATIRYLLRTCTLYRSILLKGFKRTFACGADPYPGISKETLIKLHSAYANLLESNSSSLLKKYLDQKTFHRLQQIKTPIYTSSLLDCIQCGLKHHDSRIGVYAPDNEAYKVFDLLFNPIIEELHSFKKDDIHPPPNYGNISEFENIDPQMYYILSTRMRVARNLTCYPLAPKMTECHYVELEKELLPTLLSFDGDHRGWFYPLQYTFRSYQVNWIRKHLYKDPDRFMEAGNICRHLPTGRGFFHNLYYTFSVWINYEDHLRIVSMQQGGDFGKVYQRLVDAMKVFNSNHDFYYNNHLGYLTTSPEKLGNGFRCSVLIKLLKLPQDQKAFQEVLDKHKLQVRGTYGSGTPVEDGIYDLSNKYTLGVTEYDCVKTVYNGVKEIINLEKCIKRTNSSVRLMESLG